MGLLQELSRYLSAIYDDGSLAKENEQLREKYNELETKYNRLCWDKDTLLMHKKTLLDEITLCQQRIDSLLRQLREKNNGK